MLVSWSITLNVKTETIGIKMEDIKKLTEQCILNSDKIHVVAQELKSTKRQLNRLAILYVVTTFILAAL